MLYLIYLIVVVALIALAWMVIAAVGAILFYVMLAIVIGTVLIAHGRVYFMDKHPGISRGLMYVPVLGVLLIAVAAWVPGLGFLAQDPWTHVSTILACSCSALYFVWGSRKTDEHQVHPFFSGPAFPHALRTAIRTLPSLLAAGKRVLPWMFSHWIGILAGIAAALFSIPIALGLLALGAISTVATGVAVGAIMFLPTLGIRLAFRLSGRRPGGRAECPECGRSHPMPSPGPWGLMNLRCSCGGNLDLWDCGKMQGESREHKPWYQRPRVIGAQPLAAVAIWLGVGVYMVPPLLKQTSTPQPPLVPTTVPPGPPTHLKPLSKKTPQSSTGTNQPSRRQEANESKPALEAKPKKEKNPFDIQE